MKYELAALALISAHPNLEAHSVTPITAPAGRYVLEIPRVEPPQLVDPTRQACTHRDDFSIVGGLPPETIADGLGIVISSSRYFTERDMGDSAHQEARRRKYENSLATCTVRDYLAARGVLDRVYPPGDGTPPERRAFIATQIVERILQFERAGTES